MDHTYLLEHKGWLACIGHDYIGHNYVGPNYIGHNYTCRNYLGRNYLPERKGRDARLGPATVQKHKLAVALRRA